MAAAWRYDVDVLNMLGVDRLIVETSLVADLAENVTRLQSEIGELFPNSDFNGHSEIPQVDEMVRTFIHDYQQIIQRLRCQRDSLRKRLEEHFSILDNALRFFRSFRAEKHLGQVKKRWQTFKRMLEAFDSGLDLQESIQYQTGLANIMRRLKAEPDRHLFWTKYLAQFGSHVVPKKTLKPATSTDNQAAHSQLPSEIMTMIYDCADLETCVNLRETSSAWFHTFHRMDFKAKLARRNPWITPQDDLGSWSECVLVFVARLKTWPSADSIDNISIPAKAPSRKKMLVAVELESDEKLPTNFSTILGDAAYGIVEHLEVWTSDNERHSYLRDPWTHESRDMMADKSFDVVTLDEDKYVIRCKGLEITLPPSLAEAAEEMQLIRVYEAFVFIELANDQAYIVPRDKPHFNSGLLVDCPDGSLFEAGGVVYEHTETPEKGTFRLRLYDPETRTMVDCAHNTGQYTANAASYNGLIWWVRQLEDGECAVFPTFLDLASPGKMYYHPEKGVRGAHSEFVFQCSRARGMGQFVVSKPFDDGCERVRSELQVVDLAAGVITDILPPSGWPRTTFESKKVFIGSVEGDQTEPSFQARIMSEKAVQEATRSALQSLGVPEDEW